MTHKTHRMTITRLIGIETTTGHHYLHTVSKTDPSIVTLNQTEIDRMFDELKEVADHRDMRWF